jgi:hypothetical protein
MIVALDLKRSRYFLYNHDCAAAFAEHYLDHRELNDSTTLEPMILDRIITREPSHQSFGQRFVSDHRAMRFEAFDAGRWESRTLIRNEASKFHFRPFFRMIRGVLLLKIFGFTALSALERVRPRTSSTAAPTAVELTGSIAQYLSAAIWSPFRITCLPFSFSLATHLRQSNIPAQLVIGVRPIPFVAHAWVEIDGHVYGDDLDLKKSYGEIYRTPHTDGTC